MQIERLEPYYVSYNGDKYIISNVDNKWIVYIIDIDHPDGKLLAINKDYSKILEKIPSEKY